MEESSNKILTDILERTVRVETKIDQMTDIKETANNAKSKADEALSSTRSAHKRLDKIDKIIFWVSTTIIGSVIIAILALLYKK